MPDSAESVLSPFLTERRGELGKLGDLRLGQRLTRVLCRAVLCRNYQLIDAEAGTLENVVDLGLSQVRRTVPKK